MDHKAVVSYLSKLAHRGNPARNTLAIMREKWRKKNHGIDRRTARARPARHRWGCHDRCCPVGTELIAGSLSGLCQLVLAEDGGRLDSAAGGTGSIRCRLAGFPAQQWRILG